MKVPNGGYITSCFLQVAKDHFSKTLSKQNQPHTITVHLEFVRRTEIGPALFTVKDVKLGRATSTIHITLTQNGREEVMGYFIHSNMHKADGPTYDTHWKLEPPPRPVDINAMIQGSDKNWAERKVMPFASFRKASTNMRSFYPRGGQIDRSIADQWMGYKNGEKITNVSLGLLSDLFPMLPETFLAEVDPYSVEAEAAGRDTEAEFKKGRVANFWYPTLLLNLDIKKVLPEGGVDFLSSRVRAKVIKDGRYDLEVIMMDQEGDVVCLSHHVCMILPASRNLAKRSDGKADGVSKL